MRAEIMSLTAAVRGLIVFLLSVSVVQMENGWSVRYTSEKICAPTGSAVNISCYFHYPAMIDYEENRLEETFWFTSVIHGIYSNVEMNSSFSGRVKKKCGRHKCSLKIENLRKSDTDNYKFRFVTNKDQYWGRPGVDLHVTDLEVQVSRQGKVLLLECLSSCPDQTSFVWLKNKQIIEHATSRHFHPVQDFLTEEYSCALHRSGIPSPPVYAPNRPVVSGISSAEIKRGSSVTLTCSSDANPAANYTWYKINKQQVYRRGPQLFWESIESSHSGNYSCEAVSVLGKNVATVTINVQYAPDPPSVSASPSAEIVEGSSVTVTCSSDANPAANYTWYKEDEDSPVASGQIFTITDVRAEHSGNYHCEALNNMGRRNSSLQLTVVTGGMELPIVAGSVAVVLLVIVAVTVLLWVRKKRASSEPAQAAERRDDRHQSFAQRPHSERRPAHESSEFIHHAAQVEPQVQDELQYASVQFSQNQPDLYCNVRPARPIRHTERQDTTEYAAVRFPGNATRTRRQEEDIELYSTVQKH